MFVFDWSPEELCGFCGNQSNTEMTFHTQPTVEELKKDTIFLRYIIYDSLPTGKALKRMTYYTELASRPGEIFHGRSYRHSESEEDINDMLASGQIIKVPGDVINPWEKDVFLNSEGKIFLLRAWAPWEETDVDPIKDLLIS